MTPPIYTQYSGLIYTLFMSIMEEISLYCATRCDIRFEFSSVIAIFENLIFSLDFYLPIEATVDFVE